MKLYPSKPWRIQIELALLLVVSVFALYVSSLNYPMIFDSLAMNEPAYKAYANGPLFNVNRWLSHWTLGSIQWHYPNPTPIHRTINLALHLANVVTLFYFFQLLLRHFDVYKPNSQSHSQTYTYMLASFFAALLFGINPVGIYTTAYEIQRSMLLITFFGVWSLITWIQALKTNSRILCYVTCVLYFLTLASKEHAIMYFALYVLLGYRFIEPKNYRHYILPFILFSVIAYNTFHMTSAFVLTPYEQLVRDTATPNTSLNKISDTHLYAISVVNQGYMFFRYVLFWLVPEINKMSLNMMFPYPTSLFQFPQILGFIGFIAWGLSGLYFFTRKNNGYQALIGFGMLYPLVLMGTEFSTVRFHEHIVLYRSYLWMSGFFVLLPVLVRKVSFKIFTPILIVVAVAYFHLASQKLFLFSDRLLAWKDAADKIDLSKKDQYTLSIYRNFANTAAYYSIGGNFDKAIEYYKLALDIRPDHAMSTRALGHLYLKKGLLDQAKPYLQRAVELDPNYADAHYNLGIYYTKVGDIEKSIKHYLETIRIDDTYTDAYYNLGNIYTELKQYEKAIRFYNTTLNQDRYFSDAYYNRGNAYFRLNRFENAIDSYRKATIANPRYVSAFYNLAMTYIKTGQYDLSRKAILQAIKISPKHVQSLNLLKKLNELQKQQQSQSTPIQSTATPKT